MVKCAEQSPRICEDGSIRWYVGDTFSLEFDLTFTDDAGDIVETLPSDKIKICFTDMCQNVIHETEVTGTNVLTVNIDAEATKKFKVGKYNYCVRRVSQFTTTIMRLNRVVVE